MAGLPDEAITNVVDGVETTIEEAEVLRCARCRNRTGRKGAVCLAFHGVWCLRCFSDQLLDVLS